LQKQIKKSAVMKILLAEDEQNLASLIRRGLEEGGFEVETAIDGREAEQMGSSKDYDVIILDVMLPYADGKEVCESLRKKGIKTPILMLTALGTTDDKVSGLDAGADDYLVKPFHFKELIARLKALVRRSVEHGPDKVYKVSDLEINMDSRTVKRAGQPIRLTSREFSLLELFIKNKGKVLSRTDISGMVWDINFDTGTNVIDVYVNYLRNKIDKGFATKLIHTVIGIGYVLKEDEAE
jgi:DNA-binding response OmpR family regulator